MVLMELLRDNLRPNAHSIHGADHRLPKSTLFFMIRLVSNDKTVH